jgi:hypothetical protein
LEAPTLPSFLFTLPKSGDKNVIGSTIVLLSQERAWSAFVAAAKKTQRHELFALPESLYNIYYLLNQYESFQFVIENPALLGQIVTAFQY